MKARAKGHKPSLCSVYWIFHFGFHLLMAVVALAAGMFIISSEEAILPGLALCGAAAFAFVNGINGFREMIVARSGRYLRDN